ncbi:hypothetical protein, partial [uncultured Capnocytophaga sp.]|uniref:hypothetical protein n=1 Tax=uncultured Capnocytophaga sp. TaxID=159273 RepID=UPI002602CDDF
FSAVHFTQRRLFDWIKTPLFLRPIGVPTGLTGIIYFDKTPGSATFRSTCLRSLVTTSLW